MIDKTENNQFLFLPIGPEHLKTYFISHLDRIYCAKSHLLERLPEIIDYAHFNDLKHAIAETMDDVEKQIIRMEAIYILLNAESSVESCEGLIGTLEDAFTAIHQQSENSELRDLTILFYLTNIESIEMASFQVLQMAAVKLKNKEISQLLKENFDEARADRMLLLLITSNYITN